MSDANDSFYIEIKCHTTSDAGPETATWHRKITTGHLSTNDMIDAMNALIIEARRLLREPAPPPKESEP